MTTNTLHKGRYLKNAIDDLEVALGVIDQDHKGPIKAITFFTNHYQSDDELKSIREPLRAAIEGRLKELKNEFESL